MANQNTLVNNYISYFNSRFPELKLTTDELKTQHERVDFMDKLYCIYEALAYGLSKEDYFDKVSDVYSEEAISAARKLQRLKTLCDNLVRYSKGGSDVKFHKFFTPDTQLIISIFKMLETFECVSSAIRDDHIKLTKEYTEEANAKKELHFEITTLDEELTADPTTVLTDATNELNELRETRRKLHDSCVALKTKTSSEREAVHTEGQNVNSLKAKLSKLAEDIKSYEHRYQCEVAKLVVDADEILNERQRLSDSEKAVKNDIRILHSKINQNAEKNNSINNLADKINYLDKEVALAEVKTVEIDQISAVISNTQQKIEATQDDIVKLRKKIPILSSEYEGHMENSRNKNKEFKETMSKLKGEIAHLYDKFNEAVNLKLEKCEELAKVQQQKTSLKSELDSLKENVKKEVNNLDNDFKKHKDDRREFINDIVEFRKETKLTLHDPTFSQLETDVKILETMDKEAIFHKRYIQERGTRRNDYSVKF